MGALKHPLMDLVYNDETGRYIGMLERKLVKLSIDDLKFRALLELLTDEDWDDYHFGDEDAELMKLAVDTLKRRLGLKDSDARKLVAQRWDKHNPPPADPSKFKTHLFGPSVQKTAVPHNVTIARPIEAEASPGYNYRKHLAGLAQSAHDRARRRQQAGIDVPKTPLQSDPSTSRF